MTAQDVIAWLDQQVKHYDLLRETFTRTNKSVPAAIAEVRMQTAQQFADELRRMLAEESTPVEAKP